ncbi:putative reverse transcriptase domain-containing protein [Tanacetum coccineum]
MIKSFSRGTSCGRDGLSSQHLMNCLSGVAVAISDELVSSITQVVNLFLDGKCPKTLGEYFASVPLTPLVKPGGGIRPIAVCTIWRRLISKVSAVLIGHSLDDLQFGVGVSGGGEVILHAVNRLIEGRRDDEVRLRCPAISRWVKFCYSHPTRLYYGEHTLWSCQGVQQGDPLGPLLFSLVLHPLICKIRGSFNRSLQAWYLDDDTIIGDTMVAGEALERIVTASGPSYVDRQMETFQPYHLAFGDCVYYAAFGRAFTDALCVFNTKMETDLLSNTSEIAARKLIKKLADIYFTRVTQTAEF